MRAYGVVITAACSFRLASTTSDGARSADGPPMMICPAAYQSIGSAFPHGYRFVASMAAWLTAEQTCEGDGSGMHLIILDEPGEIAAVDAISSASRWIGESDRVTSGTWLWVTGQAASPPGGSKSCGFYNAASQGGTPGLDSDDCTATYAYVCECDQKVVDHASY